MNKEKDYASDSDESDEDFRPEGAGESVSEEESNGDDSESEEQPEEGGGVSTKRNVRKGKKLTKKIGKKRKAHKEEDSDDEGSIEKGHNVQAGKRSTRRTEGDPHTNGGGKSIEKDTLDSDEEDKSRTNALWADFLKDVKPDAKVENKSNGSSARSQHNPSTSNNGKLEQNTKTKETSIQNKEEPKKVTVTQVLDFAGEEIRVQNEIDASSIKENKAAATSAPKMQPFGRIMPGAGLKRSAVGSSSGGGLGSLLNQIGKKKKISVLEKSQMDWKSFKSDEGIEEELQTFNKGKDGYLERQDFLQRTDLRQFEIEKNLRQSSRRPL
ncbi:craniofacial development protein 1 [Stomoxys calcitrans]|uniref:craniofacial development protein 1 n=1 Tax=Stomoxys calcitrans TaxID=35570 RepID=UPI0027E2F36F|nr:craniofacial development protein 1 [Stomoxys calcitrans]